jgi:hypothetical protein
MRRAFVTLSLFAALAAASLAAAAPAAPAASRARAAAKGDWPETRVGALARRWTEAFGKGEPAMRACLAEIMAPEALARRGLDARMDTYRTNLERFGSLMLVAVDSSGANSVKVKLAAADFSTHVFTFEAQAKPPYKLLQVMRTETRHTGGHGGMGH